MKILFYMEKIIVEYVVEFSVHIANEWDIIPSLINLTTK